MLSSPVHPCGSYFYINILYGNQSYVSSPVCVSFNRCNVDNKVSRVAWLNRTTILFTGNEKWSLDPRVVLLNTAVTEYSIKIINVNLYDEGPYVCSILTNKKPESTKVHLIVQGKSWEEFFISLEVKSLHHLMCGWKKPVKNSLRVGLGFCWHFGWVNNGWQTALILLF